MTARCIKKTRILLVAESFSPKASGGSVTLRMANVLKDAGAIVKILSPDRGLITPCNNFNQNDAESFKYKSSSYLHIFPGKEVKVFKKVVCNFKPNVIHFCSLDYPKSRFLLKYASKMNIRLVVQPWLHTYFCDQTYDYIHGHECGKCASGHFYNAWLNKCGKRLPWHRLIKKISRPLLRTISRHLLRHDVLNSDIFLSTNKHMDKCFISYGIPGKKILRLPLPFDPKRMLDIPVCEGKDFIYYTQLREHKGAHLLQHIIRSCPSTAFSLYPIISSRKQTDEFGIDPDILHNVHIDSGLSWHGGLAERVAGCRGVLLTTLWPTTTEYALLEAMAFSKPIIAFDVGVHRDILINRKNALVVPCGDVQAFAEAVKELDQNSELRIKLGKAAYQTFKELTDDKILVDILTNAYTIF